MLAKPNMLSEALSYAARGWPVFPCNPNSDPDKAKRPLNARAKDANGKPIDGTGGVSAATTDERTIRDWWGQWPNALIGVALGKKTGLWVVDYDPREGESVDSVAQRFTALVGSLPLGPKSLTQSGGWHIWFKMPVGEDVPKNSVGRGEHKYIDWRAEGGYVCLPPSVMSNGNKYEWIISPDAVAFPDAPAELLDLVFKRGKFAPPKREVAPKRTGPVPDSAIRKYCEAALSRAVENIRGMPPGTRNSGLNSVALGIGHLIGEGRLDMDEADFALRTACYSWGIGDTDKGLKPGGTLERALVDGARDPADLSHVGNRTGVARRDYGPEPEYEHSPDPETGEFAPIAEREPDADHDGGEERDNGGYTPDGEPFRCLGYHRETYFYFSVNKQQITQLKAPQHTMLNLLQIADLNTWADFIGVQGEISKAQWSHIADSLMKQCHRAGIFVEKYVRGRGAWMEGKTVIVHTGDSARIAGEIVPLSDIPGRFIYEKEEAWEFEFGSPASNSEAHALADICGRLTWVDPMSGALLAGWNVIAPVCGALRWRPHIWITGPSGSGKSTAVEEIVGRIAGPASERFEGNTTEAGIRQKMGFDARPIILDEAESEDAAQAVRMQQILSLARIASSGGTVTKGSTGGRAMDFVARSCFAFSSISTALKYNADESRVTRLILMKNSAPDAMDHYQALMRDINKLFTPKYAGAMFSRTIKYLPELLENIETFKVAAAIAFKNRRAADQIGPMLAGFYLCHSTGKISLADAEKFIAKHDWTDHAALDNQTEEMRLFEYLMSRRIKLTQSGSPREVSIGQAIEDATDPSGLAYADALASRGIKVGFDTITISNSADPIREMLRDKPWANDWKRPLSMIDGAAKTANAVYFSPGLISRGVILPMSLLRARE